METPLPHPTILIVGHGSRVPEAVAQFEEFMAALSARLEQAAHYCFLELADPDLATGLAAAAERSDKVIVLPLFLGAAGHHKNDVAAAIQWARAKFPQTTFHYGAPLGIHAKLVELLDLRVGQALQCALPPQETAVLIVGRGSSDPDNNSEIAKLAHLLFEKRPYLTVEYAFQAAARPDVMEGVRHCKLLGARQVVVAPFILFTGTVEEEIRAASTQVGRAEALSILHAGPLGVDPLLLDVVVQRLQEAAGGAVAMNCDLCKYRLPMAGYERQAGQPQTTDHLHGGSGHDHPHDH